MGSALRHADLERLSRRQLERGHELESGRAARRDDRRQRGYDLYSDRRPGDQQGLQAGHQQQRRRPRLAELGDRQDQCQVLVNDTSIGPIHRTFSDVAVGDPVALLGSSGFLEIAVNQGRAIERFGPAERALVDVRCR